jgi:hypothetical protein
MSDHFTEAEEWLAKAHDTERISELARTGPISSHQDVQELARHIQGTYLRYAEIHARLAQIQR